MVIEFIVRWFHVLFGIVWVGMLYYFNFVQTEYFKEAEAGAKADAMKKLAPRALWWFRWGALLTFLTGLSLFYQVGAHSNPAGMPVIWMGVLAGTLMFLNVWLVIWPKQQIVLGMKPGDGPAAAAKAGLASRTNTLFSGPMLFGMLGSKHLYIEGAGANGLLACAVILLLLEVNALFGKTGPMTSVVGVVHMSVALTAVFWALLAFL
ncbi:MAG: urate hydroxylase PuuD [Halioglobus sp.]